MSQGVASPLVEHHAIWSGLGTDGPAEVGVLGIPFDNGTSWRNGARFAPQRLRSITPHLAFINEEGQTISSKVRDYGDVESDLAWERFFNTVQRRAANVLASHRLSLFLGGDHSVTIPLFKAFAAQHQGTKLGYIHFDAHPDLANSFEGHRWSHACTARRNLEVGLQPAQLAFVGLRSYLSEEINFQHEHPEIGWHTARSIYQRGIQQVADDVIAQLQDADAVYLSLDIDGFDPAFAPGTGTPEAGGLSSREGLEFLRRIFTQLPVLALDIVEVSPPLDHSDITSLLALKLIYEVLGTPWPPATGGKRSKT